MMEKPAPLLILTFLLMLSSQGSSTPVTVILKDDVGVEDDIVSHSLTAFNDLRNVTVIDYFSNVSVNEAVGRERFLGREWVSVKIEVGDLREGENKTITYEIIGGRGEAMLGADTYYLNGEKHQLFPMKTVINVGEGATTEAVGDQGTGWVAPIILLTILSIAVVAILYLKHRRES